MKWEELPMSDRAAYMRVAVQNGYRDIRSIREAYNKYDDGGPYSTGALTDALWRNAKAEENYGDPTPHYNNTIPEDEIKRLGYRRDSRDHLDDRVKLEPHPSHPSRGTFKSLYNFELTDKGMENPNYTLFGLTDKRQDPQATLTYKGSIVLPEITVTPNGNYYDNTYDNIKIKFAKGGYKLPKKRTVIKTIKLNNGQLTYEQDSSGNGYWFRNGKYITPSQLTSYKYYDPAIKGYRQLGKLAIRNDTIARNIDDASTSVYTPNIDRLHLNAQKAYHERPEETFPKYSKDYITLKTDGKMNLASIPLNMLDSIAVNAGRAHVPFETALGLVGKESTFGGVSIPLQTSMYYKAQEQGAQTRKTREQIKADVIKNFSRNAFDAHTLTNNHAYFTDPATDYLNSLSVQGAPEEELIKKDKDAGYAIEHGIVDKFATPQYSPFIMADAFMRYNAAPDKYNPGQSNYPTMVTNIGKEVFNEPQIQKYWKTRGQGYYNKGTKEKKHGGYLTIK